MSSEATESKKQRSLFNLATQILLPILTITGFLLTSLKIPEWGLIFNLSAQIFWLYASWKAWKEAGQVGILNNNFIYNCCGKLWSGELLDSLINLNAGNNYRQRLY